jgi:alkanesulfonate monooxygenase SsuD/methylene tetrahydromethanopterin reductase-like flavin-dependent oxidoreductase (luciferase family)
MSAYRAVEDRRRRYGLFARAVPTEVIRNAFLIGTPEQVIDRLRPFGPAGLRHAVLGPVSALSP